LNQQILTRQELYELVWNEPMLTLAKRFVISDNGLRKICIRMSIPLPKAGHWQQVQFGKKVTRPPLPKSDGEEQVILTGRDENSGQDFGTPSPLKLRKLEIEKDPRVVLKVPDRLTQPHQLIIAAQEVLRNQKPDAYQYKGTVSSMRSSLNIRVAPANVGRALRFIDTLFKALVARGHAVEIRNGSTVALVGVEDFKMLFREKMKKAIENNGHWDQQVFLPTGVLAFQVDGYYGKEWKDGTKPLENHVSAIIAHLELNAEERRRWQLERQRKEEEQREQERLQAELKARRDKELSDFKTLLENAERWHKAENLRHYIATFEQKAPNNPALTEWIEWAKEKADWYDSFTESDDQWLSSIDRNTLRKNHPQ
jgi:hypothetical protein